MLAVPLAEFQIPDLSPLEGMLILIPWRWCSDYRPWHFHYFFVIIDQVETSFTKHRTVNMRCNSADYFSPTCCLWFLYLKGLQNSLQCLYIRDITLPLLYPLLSVLLRSCFINQPGNKTENI